MPLILIVALLFATGALLWLTKTRIDFGRETTRLHRKLTLATERSEAAEDHLQLLFSTNPYPMWIYDQATLRFVAVNDAAVQTYGFSREEFLGMTLLEIRHPEDKATLMDAMNGTPPGFNVAGVWRHRRKNGTTLFVEIRAFQYERHGRSYELVSANDVTERRSVEEAFRQSQVSLQSLVDSAPFGICRTSLDEDRFESLNPAMLKILGGYTFDEAKRLKISAQVYSDPKGRGRMIEVLRRNVTIQGYEISLLRRDGNSVPVRISGSVARDAQTGVEYFAGYIEDMTQQSALEQQVRQVQKLEAVGRLAGGVAHDFNNILVVIKLSTELMLAQITPDNPAQ